MTFVSVHFTTCDENATARIGDTRLEMRLDGDVWRLDQFYRERRTVSYTSPSHAQVINEFHLYIGATVRREAKKQADMEAWV